MKFILKYMIYLKNGKTRVKLLIMNSSRNTVKKMNSPSEKIYTLKNSIKPVVRIKRTSSNFEKWPRQMVFIWEKFLKAHVLPIVEACLSRMELVISTRDGELTIRESSMAASFAMTV